MTTPIRNGAAGVGVASVFTATRTAPGGAPTPSIQGPRRPRKGNRLMDMIVPRTADTQAVGGVV